jgi:hypothetical protein
MIRFDGSFPLPRGAANLANPISSISNRCRTFRFGSSCRKIARWRLTRIFPAQRFRLTALGLNRRLDAAPQILRQNRCDG